MSRQPNAQYNVAAPGSLPVRIASRQRQVMFDAFVREAAPDPSNSILDVGVTRDQSYNNSNYLKSWYPCKFKITAAGIDDAAFLEDLYPGLASSALTD